MNTLIVAGIVLAAAAGVVHQVGETVENLRAEIACPPGYWRVRAVVVPLPADPEQIRRMPHCVPPPPTDEEIRELELDPPPAPPVLEDDEP